MNYLSSSDDEEEYEPRRVKIFRQRVNFNLEEPYFKERFRLRRDEFEFVLTRIGTVIQHPSNLNNALSPEQQLLITLHWMGNGGQYHGVSDMHGVDKSTVCRTLKRVIKSIVENMFTHIVNWPEDRSQIAGQFFSKGGFPLVAGCVDGTLINIDAPTEHEEQFVDRHGNHSINCMMICGPNYEIYYVNCRWPGACHDSRVLRNSIISDQFENGWRPFPNCVLLGDSGYSLKEWLMVPINIDPSRRCEQRYNRCHKATRRIIENTYGILRERFPCINYLRIKPEFAGLIVMAAATMHNVAKKDDFAWNFEENMEDPVNIPPTMSGNERMNEFLALFE